MSRGRTPKRGIPSPMRRSEEHTSELQSHLNLVCRLLLETQAAAALRAEPSDVRGAAPARYSEPHRGSRVWCALPGSVVLNGPRPDEIYPLPPRTPLPI